MKITPAWAVLGVTPKRERSWSAWTPDGSTLYITLPDPDVKADGVTIDLWHRGWRSKNGRKTVTNTEQEAALRDAIAFGRPVIGFRVRLDTAEEHITEAYPHRLLPMVVTVDGAWRIIGKAPAPIIVGATP